MSRARRVRAVPSTWRDGTTERPVIRLMLAARTLAAVEYADARRLADALHDIADRHESEQRA